MNITDLPPDATREYLFHLDPNSFINHCTSNAETFKLCSDHYFLKNYVYNNFDGLNIDGLTYPRSNWDKLLFINRVVQDGKNWKGFDISADMRPIYRQTNESRFVNSKSLDRILVSAISSGSIKLLELTLNSFEKLIRSTEARVSNYGFLLTAAYAEAINRTSLEKVKASSLEHWLQYDLEMYKERIDPTSVDKGLLNKIERISRELDSIHSRSDPMLLLLLKYHIPTGINPVFKYGVVYDAILSGNINLVNKFLIEGAWIDEEDAKFAEANGQLEIAALIRDYIERYPDGYAYDEIEKILMGSVP